MTFCSGDSHLVVYVSFVQTGDSSATLVVLGDSPVARLFTRIQEYSRCNNWRWSLWSFTTTASCCQPFGRITSFPRAKSNSGANRFGNLRKTRRSNITSADSDFNWWRIPGVTTDKRWLVARPSGGGCGDLLARAVGAAHLACMGNQAGGRVFLFLPTGAVVRDYGRLQAAGVDFCERPRDETYGRVAVFADLYGNRWDLIEPVTASRCDM